MRITDILSHPFPIVLLKFGLQFVSSHSSAILGSLTLRFICRLTKSTAYWFEWNSQIPSQPMIKKSTLESAKDRMSGIAEIIWSLGGNRLFFLYIRSPIARDKLRLPFTRPSLLTKPPAFWIRALSVAFCGLWSIDNATDFPLTDKTQRESPALAQKIVPGELV